MKFDFFPRAFEVAPEGTPPPVVTPPPPGDPWYKGKFDERTLGHVQNHFPQHLNDPASLAVAAVQSQLNAQKLLSAPPAELVRIPTKADDPLWNDVHKRLGRPDDATGYGDIKNAKGEPLEANMAEWLRSTAHKLNLPKDAAPAFANEVLKFGEKQAADAKAQYEAKLSEEKTALTKNWGSNFDANKEMARKGATALGFDAEIVNALESVAGYSKVLEGLRKVGAATREGKFISSDKSGGGNGEGGPMTREQAVARHNEMKNDQVWMDKYAKGDRETLNELDRVERVLASTAPMASFM